jgi:hypothetical protein
MPAALAYKFRRRLVSAHSLIVKVGGGARIVSALRVACASRAGPIRIKGDGRAAGEFRERFGNRVADLRARNGNGSLLVQERRQSVRQDQKARVPR